MFLTLSWLHTRVIVLGQRSRVQGNRAILQSQKENLSEKLDTCFVAFGQVVFAALCIENNFSQDYLWDH